MDGTKDAQMLSEDFGICVRNSSADAPTTMWMPAQWNVYPASAEHNPGLIGIDTEYTFDFLHELLGFPQAAPLTTSTPLIIKAVVNEGSAEKYIVIEHIGDRGPSIRREDIWLKRANEGESQWAATLRLNGSHGYICPGDRVLIAHADASNATEADVTAGPEVMDFATDGTDALGLFQLTDFSGNGKIYGHLIDLVRVLCVCRVATVVLWYC